MPSSCPRVAVVVGHHPDAPGARFDVHGVTKTEYSIWNPFARELAQGFRSEGMEAEVIRRPNPRPDEALGREIKSSRVDFAFELHFNAVKNADISGTLMIYREGHDPSKTLAHLFQKQTTDVLGLRDRATFGRSDLGIMRHTPNDLPLILCEPAFGSNPADVVTMLSEIPDLMKAYRFASKRFANRG